MWHWAGSKCILTFSPEEELTLFPSQLNASDINFAIVRPLVMKYARLRNIAVVYACLVVRSYFLAQADLNLAFMAVMQSRASLCELLALKLMSRFASHNTELLAVLTTSWCPLAGASSATVEEVKYAISGHDLETSHTALEVGTAPDHIPGLNDTTDGDMHTVEGLPCHSSSSEISERYLFWERCVLFALDTVYPRR